LNLQKAIVPYAHFYDEFDEIEVRIKTDVFALTSNVPKRVYFQNRPKLPRT